MHPKRNVTDDMPAICDIPHQNVHEYDIEFMLPDDEFFIDSSILFQLMADATRLKILYCLFEHEYCVYDLAQLTNMSAPAVSHHLRSLRQLNIINSRRDGKHVFYSFSDNDDAQKIQRLIKDL